MALGRALVRQPRVFLFDEPLSNLDAPCASNCGAEIAALRRRAGAMMIYVTHDQAEAMAMADRVAVMKEALCSRQPRRWSFTADRPIALSPVSSDRRR